MIQELLGGAGLVGGGERKISLSRVLENSTSPNSLSSSPTLSPSPSPSPSSSTTSTPATSTENPNLRCPRCDSSNTKFCYYNNYNLTQPRHFCKTCRRYWTKGGALRNVPIGGGCRKNKNAATIAPSIGKSSSSSGKFKSPEFGKPGLVSGLDHQQFIPSNPNDILWASQQNSHLLAFLRATQQNPNPNPNPMSSSFGLKEEHGVLSGTHLASDANGRALGFDHLGQASSIGLCGSFWRNNQEQAQQNHHNQHQNGFNVVGEVQNSGVQDLYQKLRSSSANYYQDHFPVVMGNVGISSATNTTTSSSTILDSAPVGGSEMGYWNPIPSWSDLTTTNGTAYP